MAGIEFDRQIFSSPAEAKKPPVPQAFGMILLVLALGLAGFVGYKIFTQASQNNAAAAANAQVEQLQQQLSDAQKRLEDMEKRHKAAKVEPAPQAVLTPAVVKTPVQTRPVYRVVAASALPPQPKPAQPSPAVAAVNADNAKTAAMQAELTANHEAWQATTDRLADVVGAVGQQQNELAETRETVNQLLAKSRRQPVSFELMRGTSKMPVGPVTLQLKSADVKSQRYSVCVYVDDRCIELKNRMLNEVVVFIGSKDSAPLELVATKILHDQIVGYLDVPQSK
jgi:hypothetical protein